jgi:hypothetical protein
LDKVNPGSSFMNVVEAGLDSVCWYFDFKYGVLLRLQLIPLTEAESIPNLVTAFENAFL